MLISVHLPKTAGTSFLKALETVYGDRLVRDRSDYPVNTPRFERTLAALEASILNGNKDWEGIECIHGHFLPLKYLLLAVKRDLRFVTWLRHPVQRALSHYYFWQRSYDPLRPQPLHREVVEGQWTLERFCLGDEVQNLYTQLLYGFPLEMFRFIGIVEHYRDDLRYFGETCLGRTLDPHEERVGVKAGHRHEIDEGLCAEIEAHHALDMALYRRAVAMRESRLARASGA
jgi:hypothetical protein